MSGFLIRSVREEDVEGLYNLANQVYFINLPADRDILKEKVSLSIQSFNGEMEDKFQREYIFVLEDQDKKEIIGSSMIIARHGSPEAPHMYFQLKEIQKYSETIHSGIIHKVLRLCFEYDGPSEIGGLVLSPNYRSHPDKLGRQLSFARFLFMKMKRRWFKNNVLSELMPPLTENDESILWEALGRKFTNLSYQEADRLSRNNKEFITSLFPKGDIYTCLLPGEARDAIGKVGEGAEPVRHMLEKIGFKWKSHIDPFDGGPHYWAETDKISVIAQTKKYQVAKESIRKKKGPLFLCGLMRDREFLCSYSSCQFDRHRVSLPKQVVESLSLAPRDELYVTPLESTASDEVSVESK